MICPLTKTDCQYCSHESTTRPFTRIGKNAVTGMYDPKGMGKHRVKLGAYCNNHVIGQSGWVSDILQCPKEMKPTNEWVQIRRTKTGKMIIKKVLIKKKEKKMNQKKIYGQQVLV